MKVFPQIEDRLLQAQKGVETAQWQVAVELAKNYHLKHNMNKSDACREALKTTNIDPSRLNSLRKKLNYDLEPREPIERDRLLTKLQEDFVISLVSAFSVRANALTRLDMCLIAQAVGGLKETPTSGWATSFLHRHSDKIGNRNGRKSHNKSVLGGVLKEVMQWKRRVANF